MLSYREEIESCVELLKSGTPLSQQEQAIKDIGQSVFLLKREASKNQSLVSDFKYVTDIAAEPIADIAAHWRRGRSGRPPSFGVSLPALVDVSLVVLGELGERRCFGLAGHPKIASFLRLFASENEPNAAPYSHFAFVPLFRVGGLRSHLCLHQKFKFADEPWIKHYAERCQGYMPITKYVLWNLLGKSLRKAEGLHGEGKRLYDCGDKEAACGTFISAISHWPWEPANWYWCGRCRYELGETEGGISDVRFASPLQPFDPHIQFKVAALFQKWGMQEDAATYATFCLRARPGDWIETDALLIRASAHEDGGRITLAIEDYEKAVELLSKRIRLRIQRTEIGEDLKLMEEKRNKCEEQLLDLRKQNLH